MAQAIIPVGLSEFGKVAAAAGADSNYIRKQIEAGVLEFFRIGRCHFVTTKEDGELVVVCAQGEGLKPACKVLADKARSMGYATVRIHVKRPAVARLTGLDFNLAEYVYKLEL